MKRPTVIRRSYLTGTALAVIGTVQAQPAQERIVVYGSQVDIPASTSSRLGLTVAETPATVDVIDGNAIRARQDYSLIDAVTRSAGFTNEANPGNGHSSIQARGFRGNGSVTKLFDGTHYYTAAGTVTYPFDTWGAERVEILKGPASVLFGEGGIGGAINVIPRRPEFQQGGNVRLAFGEDNTTFVGLGYTNGITEDLAFRIDYSNQQSDNWVDNGESMAEMLSMSLLWQVSADLTLTARFDSGEQEPMRYFGVPVVNGDFYEPFDELNFNTADSIVEYDDDSVRLRADWQISDTLAMQTDLFQLNSDRWWQNSEFYSFDETTGIVTRWDPLVLGHDMEQTGLRTNFTFGDRGSSTGLIASAGMEINDVAWSRPRNYGPGNPNPVDFGAATNDVDPFDFMPGTLADFTDADVIVGDFSDVSQMAIFGEVRAGLTERIALVGGLRYEDVETEYLRVSQPLIDQSVDAVTGRIGLVYDLSESTTLYGQYATGATHPSSSIVTASASNREADMIESEQVEIGVKQQSENGRLNWTVALFDIVKNDLIEDDPDSVDPDDLIFIPEQTSEGVELSISAALGQYLRIYGNAAVLNAETDTGETPTYIPERTANAGLVWDNTNLRFIVDARYVDERFHPSRPLAAYTIFDASVTFPLNNELSLTLKAANLTDERYAQASYYSSTWLIGRPRTLSLMADYSF